MRATQMLSDREQTALKRVSELLSNTADPWWVLGSAAMALIGVNPGEVRDIDVLVSNRDAQALMKHHALINAADGGNDRFRSAVFLLPELGDVRVEIMAGYEIRTGGTWTPVCPVTREKVSVGGSEVFVPTAAEQIDILRQLNRPKDLARLARFPTPPNA